MATGNKNHIANLEHHSGFRAKKVIAYKDDGAGNAIMDASDTLALLYIVDSVDASITYLGKAKPGTATSSASWQIRKLDQTTGLAITYADGNVNFDNVWDNREALTYL